MNLCTGEKTIYSCEPLMAVICAYAQKQKKDFSTWDYKRKYQSLVQKSKLTFLCGDFSAFKDGRMF